MSIFEEERFTGYRIDFERRDEIIASSSELSFTLKDYDAPEEIDPRKLIRHDDQGNMGSCGGHGNANCGEYLWAIVDRLNSYDADHQISRLYCYLEAQRFDGLIGSDSGSTISSGLKVAYAGYLTEPLLPYSTPYPRNSRSLVTADMRAKATGLRIKSHAWLDSYDKIFNYLASGAGSVFPGTAWNNSFYASNGLLESVSFGMRDGGHAYAFLGYSKRKDSKGRNYIWRKNSHSNDNWTEVSPKVIDQLCAHQYTSIVGMSDLETPSPRSVDFTKESLLS
jgi:hypothetical protein